MENSCWLLIKDREGTEVHIGFPDGTHSANGKARVPVATAKIQKPEMKMFMYGHGAWRFGIEI